MEYDVIIIGGGPAGLTAGIYCTRYELKTLVIAKEVGGTLATAPHVDNWPGIPDVTGYDLMKKVEGHAKSLGVEIKMEEAHGIKKEGDKFVVDTIDHKHEAKAVIIATGQERRKLNVPGEEEFDGKGVSYCATCDGPMYKGATVGVVGGSDSAAKEALLLADYAKKVYILYRKAEIRAEPVTKKQVAANQKIEVIPNVNVVKIVGGKMMTGVELDNGDKMELEGLFIEIGGVPASQLAEGLGAEVDDKKNDIVIGEDYGTKVPGLFAAGDVTRTWEQGVVAAAGGAVAAFSAYKYVKSLQVK